MSDEAVVRIVLQDDGTRSTGTQAGTAPAGAGSPTSSMDAQKRLLERIAIAQEETAKSTTRGTTVAGSGGEEGSTSGSLKAVAKSLGVVAPLLISYGLGRLTGQNPGEVASSLLTTGKKAIEAVPTGSTVATTIANDPSFIAKAMSGIESAGRGISEAHAFLGTGGMIGGALGGAAMLGLGNPLMGLDKLFGKEEEQSPETETLYMILKEITEYNRPSSRNLEAIAHNSNNHNEWFSKIYDAILPTEDGKAQMPPLSGPMPTTGSPFALPPEDLAKAQQLTTEEALANENKLYEALEKQADEEGILKALSEDLTAHTLANPIDQLPGEAPVPPQSQNTVLNTALGGKTGTTELEALEPDPDVVEMLNRPPPLMLSKEQRAELKKYGLVPEKGNVASSTILQEYHKAAQEAGEEPKFARGGSVGGHPGSPKGTDTIPAWLSEGEFVVNSDAAQKNRGMLEEINDDDSESMARGGLVKYLAKGGIGDMAKGAVNFLGGMAKGQMSRATMAANPSSDPSVTIGAAGQALSSAAGAVAPALNAIVPGLGEVGKVAGELVQGFSQLMQAIDKTAERYGQYSPEIATAKAIADVRQSMGDIGRAAQMGEKMAKYIEARSNIEQEFEDLKTGILTELLPAVTDIVKIIGELARLTGPATMTSIRAIAESLKPLGDIVNMLNNMNNTTKDSKFQNIPDPTTLILMAPEFKDGGKWVPDL